MRTLGLILLLLFGLQPAQGSFTREWPDATGTNAVLRLYDAAGYQSRLTTTASPLERDILQNLSLSPAPAGSERRLEFDYDYLGRRIAKRVYVNGAGTPAVDLKFVYDGWNLIAELNETDNSLVRAYIWGLDLSGSLQGAGGTGGLIAVVDATEGTHFTVMDGSGNVAGLVDADTGVRSATYEYDPFGQTIRATGPAADLNPFRFSTRYTDVETGMLYYGYRYYNPSIGKWLNRDPIGEAGGLNLYRFNYNNPIRYVDPNGLSPLDVVLNVTDYIPFGFGAGLRQMEGNATMNAMLAAAGYSSLQEFQLDNPGYGGTMTAGNMAAVHAGASVAAGAATIYLYGVTSVTPTGNVQSGRQPGLRPRLKMHFDILEIMGLNSALRMRLIT